MSDKPTVQDIFLRFYPAYLDKYTPSPEQSKVANCIINCKPELMVPTSVSARIVDICRFTTIPAGTDVALCVRLFQKKNG